MFKKLVLVPLIFALGVAPALAAPTVIAELGESPLLGSSSSTAEMRTRVARNQGIVSAAGAKIGLTPGEYAQFLAAVDASRVQWVTLPRHLDAMSWQSAGTVYVLHDVVIPAGTHGWEVDVHAHGQILALYMPAKCGNLSLVRKAVPVIAARPVPTRVAALTVQPPLAAPPVPAAIDAAPAAVAPIVVPDDTAPAAPVVVAAAAFPPVAAAAAHPFALFLAPLLFGLAAISGGSGPRPAAVPAGCP